MLYIILYVFTAAYCIVGLLFFLSAYIDFKRTINQLDNFSKRPMLVEAAKEFLILVFFLIIGILWPFFIHKKI